MRTHAGGPGPEKRAVSGVSFDPVLIARGRAASCRNDLEGLSTDRSDTSLVAADARYGRGRPCDARGAWWGGRDGRLETFFPAKNDGENRCSVDAMALSDKSGTDPG